MKKYLLIAVLFCIFSQKMVAQLSIRPVFGRQPLMENTWFVTKQGDSIQLDNIRFYISDIQLKKTDNSWVKDSIKAHLIDIFEPTTFRINCVTTDLKQFKTLRFNIGIDSLTNVAGALSGDLDPQNGMYWAWQSGYINMKIEGKSPRCKTRKNVFQYHIGGYLPPFYAMRQVELPILRVDTEGVILKIDFARFFENIQIASQNSIMMPCSAAMSLADESVKMFSIGNYEE
jgi:hypothetical protein